MLYIGRKVRQILSRENGQSMVELALLMCFAVVVFLAINWDGIRDSAGGAYQKMANSLGTNSSYAELVESYKTMSNVELAKINNAQRIDIDKATLRNTANKFLGMSIADLKTIFDTTDEALLRGDTKFTVGDKQLSRGVVLFDYNVMKTGDNGEGVDIKLRSNGAGSVSNREAMQWMQGNYNTDSSKYTKTNEDISYRLFFSDGAIDKSPFTGIDKEQSATVRVYFSFDENNKVNEVNINLFRSYNKGGNNWERMLDKDLSGIRVKNREV